MIIRCHALSFVVTRCITRCTIRCHSLSLVVTRSTTRCHSLSLVVTRLSFYKRYITIVKMLSFFACLNYFALFKV